MEFQLKPWGNSQGLRFSKEFLRMAHIAENEVLNAEIVGDRIILSKAFRHKTLAERAADYDGQLNLSGEIERDAPSGNEVW